ncbi:MAG: Hydroxyacylglutathione hydrolase [Verrucomicrobiae bacterium]|nr:Hydroxyacylglutathione hydrolase [Verrucomicrobiae bacterium]
MLIESIEAGLAATNGYVVADRLGGTAVIIDAPQDAGPGLVAKAKAWNTPVSYLLNTHAHWDHYWDNAAVLRLTGAKFGIHADSAPLLKLPQARMFGIAEEIEPSTPDFFLEEGTELTVGELRFEILHCPGHCPGSVVLFERRERVAFVGDVLFAGSIGRTDLPGGDQQLLLAGIHRKLLPLGDDVKVFSGHGPVTTLGRERQMNPFLQS